MAFNILDERGVQIGELEEASIISHHGQAITVDRGGLIALVTALGAGYMERPFSLQQDAVTYSGCRITQTTGGTRGSTATIEYASERR